MNKLWYVDLEGIPRDAASGALQFGQYDFHAGAQPLPIVKLIDDFQVPSCLRLHSACTVLCCAVLCPQPLGATTRRRLWMYS